MLFKRPPITSNDDDDQQEEDPDHPWMTLPLKDPSSSSSSPLTTLTSMMTSRTIRHNEISKICCYSCCCNGGGGGRRRRRRSYSFWGIICFLGTLFLLVNVIYLTLMVPQPPLSITTTTTTTTNIQPSHVEPWDLPKTKIHAVIFFKEESHALVEILLHLYSQGLDHVILIDNLSQHELPMDVLQLFQRPPYNFATLRQEHRLMSQKPAYRSATQLARWKGADWILAVDADEFPWATQLGSLQSYLTLQDQEICSIAIPFRLFGSDQREEQPNSLLQGFVGRTNATKHPSKQAGYKTVSRLSCTLWMAIHHAAVLPRYSLRGYAALPGFPNDPSPIIDGRTEGRSPPDLVTNHYRTQSHRFFLDIKQTRGRPNNNGKVRDEGAFRRGDRNDILDYGLYDKAQARFSSLYGTTNVDNNNLNLALRSNINYTSPWPLSNVQAALKELQRHQVLVLFNAVSDNMLPDTLAGMTRNAAMLDPTLDCLVRIPPGHVQAAMESRIGQFCKIYQDHSSVRTMNDRTTTTTTTTTTTIEQSWQDFVHTMTTMTYHQLYHGFVVIDDPYFRFPMGWETTNLRKAVLQADDTHQQGWQIWKSEDWLQQQQHNNNGPDPMTVRIKKNNI